MRAGALLLNGLTMLECLHLHKLCIAVIENCSFANQKADDACIKEYIVMVAGKIGRLIMLLGFKSDNKFHPALTLSSHSTTLQCPLPHIYKYKK